MSSTQFFDVFMPALEQAGRYALEIRDRIESRPQKSGDAWTSVVTDADLGVQHYLEAVALAEFPDWGFWGEERDASFHTPYFRENAEYLLALDPINGTRIYRERGDDFDIIMSLIRNGRVEATLSYMPVRRQFYGADAETGAFLQQSGEARAPLVVDNQSMTLAVYKADDWLASLPDAVVVYDTLAAYVSGDPRNCMNNVFHGHIGGYLMGPTPLLDVGATAFTVAQAGGFATQPDGRPFDHFSRFDPARTEPLLVCANPALHAAVSRAIAGASA
ncbi:MAG: inositol monophosphatase family protein [Pseudomonadota bacterium]